jgi:hypothetical protein
MKMLIQCKKLVCIISGKCQKKMFDMYLKMFDIYSKKFKHLFEKCPTYMEKMLNMYIKKCIMCIEKLRHAFPRGTCLFLVDAWFAFAGVKSVSLRRGKCFFFHERHIFDSRADTDLLPRVA